MLSYDIHAYGRMIRDKVRTDAYAEALRRSVTRDSVVLDLGTGVGILALLACKFGARKVYAVDPNDVIQVAREVAVANGVADRIEFIQDISTEVTLPERPNLIVSEIHGIVPMFEQHLPSIIDARERLLASGARMIPQKETLWVAPVEAVESFDLGARPWTDRAYGFDWAPAMRVAVNDWFKNKEGLTPQNFIVKPACWATLDYRTVTSPNVKGLVTWTADRDALGHGLLVWFESELGEGVTLSNRPGLPETIFGQAFFPWTEPVKIQAGDHVEVSLRCDLVEHYHLWSWKTTILATGTAGQRKAQFAQSTFMSMPLAQSARPTHRAERKPKLNRHGEIQHFILSRLSGENSLQTIAEQAFEKFAGSFRQQADAWRTVAQIARKYSGDH